MVAINKYVTVVNAALRNALHAEQIAKVPHSAAGFESRPLCAWQSQVAARGILSAELVLSAYGWSLRYGSGIQNFALIAGRLGGWDEALEVARRWVASDPAHRYVYVHEDYMGPV